jgi:hypothetical protein
MKALSIRQPWVYAILHEGKDVENRTWRSHFRGWLAIHFSAKLFRGCERFPNGVKVPPLDSLDSLDPSALVAIARLVDVRDAVRSVWFAKKGSNEKRYGWILKDIRRFDQQITKEFPDLNFSDINDITYSTARARAACANPGVKDFDKAPDWDDESRSVWKVSLKRIKNFSAQGMENVYGRGDSWVGGRGFNMAILRDRSGQLRLRLWSSSRLVEQMSFKIVGKLGEAPFDEAWVPDIIREKYDVFCLVNYGK